MSLFGESAKAEILSVPLRSRRQKSAMLSSLAHTTGTLAFANGQKSLVIRAASPAVKQQICALLCDIYGAGAGFNETRDSVVVPEPGLNRILTDLKIFVPDADGGLTYEAGIHPDICPDASAETAYLRGLFLGVGAVSLKPGYHLEFAFSNGFLAADCVQLLNNAGFKAKVAARKDKTIVYIKDSETISDLLAHMGAVKAVLKLNDVAVSRDVNRITNRRLNCDLANIDKTVASGISQVAAIQRLEAAGALKGLNARLQATARLRLAYPDISLSDLAETAGISKSGMRNRLNKLVEAAESLLGKND